MATLVDLSSVPAARRTTVWSETVCERFIALDLDGLAVTGRDVIRGVGTSDIQVSRVRSGPQEVIRRPGHLGRETDAYLFVNLQIAGDSAAEQAGRSVRLRPGEAAVFTSERPYRLRFEGRFEQLVLRVSGQTARHLASRLDLRAGQATGASGALHAAILALESALDEGVPGARDLGRAVLAMVEARLPTVRTSSLETTRQRACAVIAERSDDPNLSLDAVAEALGCSPRHLHSAFAGTGGSAAEVLWSTRLDRAAERLLGRPDLTVACVAWDSRFSDASHLSRRFRARFGLSPAAWRQKALTCGVTGGAA